MANASYSSLRCLFRISHAQSLVFAFGCASLFLGCGGSEKNILIYSFNSPGVEIDANILKTAIAHTDPRQRVEIRDIYASDTSHVDINIFIQFIRPELIKNASHNWVLVNPEFLGIGEKPETYRNIDKVLCKTKYCVTLLEDFKRRYRFKFTVVDLRFTSPSSKGLDPTKKQAFFLHPAGKSGYKQTSVVLDVWRQNPRFPKIVVTCINVKRKNDCFHRHLVGDNSVENLKKYPNIDLKTSYIPTDELEKLRMEATFVVAPSEVEGFGHYINEARGYASIVITTDFPPMNELITSKYGILVKSTSNTTKGFLKIPIQSISTEDLKTAINKALSLSDAERKKMSYEALNSFNIDRKLFYDNVKKLMSSVD